MPNDKVKIYKNSARNQNTAVRQYVPQYQIMGIDPQQMNSAPIPGKVLIARGGVVAEDNPRTRRPSIRQAYAEAVPSPIGSGPVPNVGNSMEHTWAGVDSEIVDDISSQSIDPNAPMIDNNEFVSPIEEEMPMPETVEQSDKTFWTVQDLQSAIEEDVSAVSNLQDGSYILLINGVIISVGSLEDIQEEASALAFGEHEACNNGEPVPLESILVLKKIKIKTGLFLE